MKIAISKLKESEYDIVLPDIIQISRYYYSALVKPHMGVMYRTSCSPVRSSRSQVARTACQVVGELFRTMRCAVRPAFDEIVFSSSKNFILEQFLKKLMNR
jgi:hypothetical protein